ncbi:Imm50 family immunity protein [Streptomyces scopuliridis]|uniref:Imm50 family immunity protein n=1 Tax=Streptomyces scopuliridis TaxID=452529 RepID=UPI00369F45BA
MKIPEMARSPAPRNITTMTHPWIDLVRNSDPLAALYSTVPPLNSVRLRSIHLNWRGPALTLRIDLPSFPDNAPADWIESGNDTFQCHLQFLAVNHFKMSAWAPPTLADISISPTHDHRISVSVTGDRTIFSFDGSDSILVGHLSAFTACESEGDTGPRNFLGRVDSRRFTSLPNTYEKTFYEHL